MDGDRSCRLPSGVQIHGKPDHDLPCKTGRTAGISGNTVSMRANLVMSYEMYMTFYEKSASIDAFAICGNTVVGFSSDPKIDAAFMEQEAQKILRGNGFKANVKIFTRLPQFLERLDSMNEHRESLEEGIKFRPDEKYPELSRNELIKHTILAICV